MNITPERPSSTTSSAASVTTQKHATHTRLFFFLGFLGILLLAVLSSVVYLFFFYEPQASLVTTPKTVITPTSDPLVSVVPDVTDQINGVKPAVLFSDPKRGEETAKVTIIEFGDFQCGDCATMSPVISQILQEYQGQVQHVWKDFPLTAQHAQAEVAAIAARCAAEQGKFWQYHDALLGLQHQFSSQPWNSMAEGLGIDMTAFGACLAGEATKQLVIQSYFVGRALDINQTPTYFVNNRRLEGPQTVEQLRAVIDEELRK